MNHLPGSRFGLSVGRCFPAVLVGAWVAVASSTPAAPVPAIRTIALSGQQAPDTATGAKFQYIANPLLNDAGQTAFDAGLTGVAIDDTNAVGIWSDASGNLRLVARQGDQAPGTPDGVVFGNPSGPPHFFSFLALNDAGQTAFSSRLISSGALIDEDGIWVEDSNGPQLAARYGGRAAGTPDGVTLRWLDVASISFNNAGQIAFGAFLDGEGVESSNSQGIWSGAPGTIRLVARTGNHAPGTQSGVQFDSFTLYRRIGLDDAGQTAFLGYLTGNGVDFTNNNGIWAERSGELQLVARAGNPAAGMTGGVVYRSVGAPLTNKRGQVAFFATIGSGQVITDFNDRGIWSGDPDELRLVVRKGSSAPGIPGARFQFFEDHQVLLNDAGRIAFVVYLAGTDDSNAESLWAEGPDGLKLVARRGDHAPGTPSGVRFGEPGFWAFGLTGFNDAGQVAFVGTLDGPDVAFENNLGIWATDRTGGLQLIARAGDVLEVAPGDFRTISHLGRTGFNNLGQIAFQSGFTDGSSGIFISNLVAIPEPSSLLLVTLALTAVFGPRRHN